jgi:hypothetical protein
VKTKKPDRRLPTKVDITRPAVIEIIPAPVKRAVAETSIIVNIPNVRINVAKVSKTY